MRAALLSAPKRLTVEDIANPQPAAGDVLLRPLAVGVCGTDFHIFEGEANYHMDQHGHPVPLESAPQILGHEVYAEVVELGAGVTDLAAGDRVIIDQGLNCHSQRRSPVCEYCATGDSHQCEDYREHGITGLPGGMAELLAISAVNAVRTDRQLPPEAGAMTEPLACIVHSSEVMAQRPARYQFAGPNPIRTVLICGSGPAGLLFLQYLRKVTGFAGRILVSDPHPQKRALALRFGADAALDPRAHPLVEQVQQATGGRGVEYLIEATGYGPLFRDLPGIIRKQATVLLYGHGHKDVPLGVLNNVQFREANLVATVGASGGFDPQGRPAIYQRALSLLETGQVEVLPFITHRYHGLEQVAEPFQQGRFAADYIKGIIHPNH